MPGRRNPKWIALGIVALCLGGLLSYVIYSRVATETTVVAVAQTVYRGEVIDRATSPRSPCRAARSLQAVPARELDNLVGQRAAIDLVAGSVLVSSAVTAETVPAIGRAVVGLKLPTGRAPTSLLVPSSDRTPGRAAARGRRHRQAHRGHLRRPGRSTRRPEPTAPRSWSTSTSPPTQAPTIALLAAQDRIAVVRDAGK